MLMRPRLLVLVLALHACSHSSNSSSPAAAPSPADASTTAANLPASALALAAIPSAGAGNCTQLDVETQNSNGLATAVTAADTVAVSSSSTTGGFYSDSACTTKVTSVSLPSGASDAYVYYKDSTVGTATVTFTDGSNQGLTAASFSLTVTAIAQLDFVGSALAQSSTACGSLTLELRNSAGTATPTTAAVNIDLTSSSSTGVFYSDNACTTAVSLTTISSGQSDSPTFYYKDSTDGTPTLTAGEDPSQNWVPASMTAKITN